ncbi:ATP-binding protein [Streptomyces cuspidosporus]|uniref:ATP-binding protein n=1 Tax=Streptomyces cuspidosporus TaxID=66882 RepID=UPI0031FDF483
MTAQADDLYELVSERQSRPLVVTSNRAPSDWYPLFPEPVVAESLLDRLICTSHQVIMNGPGYRLSNTRGTAPPRTASHRLPSARPRPHSSPAARSRRRRRKRSRPHARC